VQTAKEQDYEAFYRQEIAYRQMLSYPPVWNLLVVMCTSENPELLQEECTHLRRWLDTFPDMERIQIVGPADAAVSKINDIYRKVIYLKTADYNRLVAVKDAIEKRTLERNKSKEINIQFDFNPMSGF
jgi:primosomal protein N' (replication factor Y)